MAYRDPLIGKTLLGRYRVVRRLARGGMGVVYLGRAEGAAGFVKPVVIKRMLTEIGDEAMEQMFVREARILSRLQHPNIVSVIDFGQEGGAYLLVMEYVHGYHLGRWARYVRAVREPLPVDLCLHIAIKILEALHYAHERRRPDGELLEIVHRDVSPSNVFIDAEGNVKLLDFGIARMSGDTGEYKTQDTTVKGKLAYLPPEMFQGDEPTRKTDIYSCGVVLHELLVGRNEFRAPEMSTTLHNVMTLEPTRVTKVRDDAPDGVDDLIAKALAKHPDARFDDADQFAQALRRLRRIPEDEADELLARTVAQDFAADIADKLSIPSLEELEEAWREPPPTTDPEAPTDPPSGQAGVSEPPTAALSNAPGRAPARAPLVVVLAVLLVAAGVAAAVALSGEEEGGPELVVIQQSRAGDDSAEPTEAPANATTTEGAGSAPEESSEEASQDGTAASGVARRSGSSRTPSRGNELSAAFARRRPDVETCFDRHTEDLTGSPRIEIRFQIDADGSVRSAELFPAEIASTPLGSCLLRVARSTEFGARDEPTAFRIPITARRQ